MKSHQSSIALSLFFLIATGIGHSGLSMASSAKTDTVSIGKTATYGVKCRGGDQPGDECKEK